MANSDAPKKPLAPVREFEADNDALADHLPMRRFA
jgi:hypothetical protein